MESKIANLNLGLETHKIIIWEVHAPMVESYGRWNGGWLTIVEQYSRRKLTYSVDKLPALSRLTSYISSQTDDEYYAGLWRDHILEDLHWRVYSQEENRQRSLQ
jgi:hypothetical protein